MCVVFRFFRLRQNGRDGVERPNAGEPRSPENSVPASVGRLGGRQRAPFERRDLRPLARPPAHGFAAFVFWVREFFPQKPVPFGAVRDDVGLGHFLGAFCDHADDGHHRCQAVHALPAHARPFAGGGSHRVRRIDGVFRLLELCHAGQLRPRRLSALHRTDVDAIDLHLCPLHSQHLAAGERGDRRDGADGDSGPVGGKILFRTRRDAGFRACKISSG